MTTLDINGQTHTVDAPPDMPVLWVLRDLVGLTGTKFGCGIAQCGASNRQDWCTRVGRHDQAASA